MRRVSSEAVRTEMNVKKQKHSLTFKGKISHRYKCTFMIPTFWTSLKIIWNPLKDFIFLTSGLSRLHGRVSLHAWGGTEAAFIPHSGPFLTGLKILWINSKRSGWRLRPSRTKSPNLTIDYWEFMWHGSWSDGEPRYLETIGREGTAFTTLPATARTYERRSSTSCFLLLILLQPVRHGSDMTRTILLRNPQIDGGQKLLPLRAVFEVYKQVNNIISAAGRCRGQQAEEHQHKGDPISKTKWFFC